MFSLLSNDYVFTFDTIEYEGAAEGLSNGNLKGYFGSE